MRSVMTLGIAVMMAVSIGVLYASDKIIKAAVSQHTTNNSGNKINQKMKIEIWSDVVCPFCYIGKTKFQVALDQFADKDNIEVEWKSYQLMPSITTQTDKNIDQVLAETKGVTIDQAKQMNTQAALMGKQAGLEYNFNKAIVANTFRAHQFLHFAKKYGKQTDAEGLMFRSYFTDGRNVDDIPTLVELGRSIGLDTVALKVALEQQTYADAVRADISEAGQIGIRSVPFFVFNGKYAVSGAQDPQTFLNVLERSFAEWEKEKPHKNIEIMEGGASCTPNGKCE